MNVNSGKPWSKVDLFDLRNGLGRGTSINEVTDFLCRDMPEVRAKAVELGLLRPHRNRTGPLNARSGQSKRPGMGRTARRP